MYRETDLRSIAGKLLAVLLLCALWTSASARPVAPGDYTFTSLDARDGLPNRYVSSILQDSRGFMWFATSGGLVRYDGHELQVFNPIPFDDRSISATHCVGLDEDDDGFLWVGTGNGLSRFDPASGKFRRYLTDVEVAGSIEATYVVAVHNPSAVPDKVAVASLDGLHLIDRESGAIETWRHDEEDSDSLPADVTLALHEDSSGNLWVGTVNGLARFDPRTGAIARYLDSADPSDVHVIPAIEPDATDPAVLWLPDWRSVVRFDTRTGESVATPLIHDETFSLQAIVGDPHDPNILWLATDGIGVARFEIDTKEVTFVPERSNDPEGLPFSSQMGMTVDRSGMIWLGAWPGGGISRFDPRPPVFRFHPHEQFGPLLNIVTMVSEDRDGIVWISAFTNGLVRLDRETGTEKRYLCETGPNVNLVRCSTNAFAHDREGIRWAGTRAGLLRFESDPDAGEWLMHDESDPASLPHNTVNALYEDRQGRLWVGTDSGLGVRVPGSDGFRVYRHDPEDETTLTNDGIASLYQDADDRIWVGTTEGLNRLDPESGRVIRYGHDENDRSSLSAWHVLAMHERPSEPGVLWVTTFGGGLNRLDVATGTFRHFTTQNSTIPSNLATGILEDDDGQLWMSTDRGLARFDPDGESFRVFKLDRPMGDSWLAGDHVRGASGVMLVGGGPGVYEFHPQEVLGRTAGAAPPVAFTSLIVDGEIVEPHDEGSPLSEKISSASVVRLDPARRDFTVQFSALGFLQPELTRLRHRLEGYETEWIETGSERSATYTNLKPGRYTLRVHAANGDGVWNESGAALDVVVRPRFWETRWFFGLAVLVGIGAIGLTFYARLRAARIREHELETTVEQRTSQLRDEKRKTEEQAERLLEMDRIKSAFFANVSHEFRTPLTLTIGPLTDLRDGLHGKLPEPASEQVELALRNSHRVLGLINQLLDAAKLEAGKMELRAGPGDIADFVSGLAQPFVPLAERRRVDFRVRTPDEPVFASFDPDQFEKVVVNLLSNAFKFTPSGGSVNLEVERDNGEITISVRDTGSGIPEEQQPHVFERFRQVDGGSRRLHPGTGIGLSLARELTELHGGRISLASREGEGSTFCVVIPSTLDRPDETGSIATAPRVPSLGPAPLPELVPESDDESATADGDPVDDVTTVLVVEDNAEVRGYLRKHLESSYRVLESVNGREGLESARCALPDLIISDVMMPEMDGYELCREVKQDPEIDFVPVILLTAKAAGEEKIEGLTLGADDYLTKPFEVAELRARVQNLIDSRRKLKERFGSAPVVRLGAGAVDATSTDDAFLERLRDTIAENLDDSAFGVERLASEMGQSRSNLYRRVQTLLDRPPNAVIRSVRLDRAAQLLTADAGTIGEIAYAVGFQSVAYFSRAFRAEFGCTPTEHRARS